MTVTSLVAISPATTLAQESNGSIENIYSPSSNPSGASYGAWTENWWIWFISIPTDQNPINDATGDNCGIEQYGPVWNLIGSGGGVAERHCTIPSNKAILIPAINVECSYAEDQSLKTPQDLIDCAKSDQDHVTRTHATLDGTELKVYRVKSDSVFNVTFPKNNIFSAPEGPSQSFSEGFWVFLKPLSPGDHVLHVQGSLVDPTVTSPVNLVEDSTYHLKVVDAQMDSGSSPNVHEQAVSLSGKSFVFPITSSSNITNINFDEQAKRLSFDVAMISKGNRSDSVSMPISWLLVGPYSIFVDGTSSALFNSTKDPQSGATTLTINLAGGDESNHKVIISGTTVAPEFPLAPFVLIITLSAVVLVTRKGSQRGLLKF